MYRKGPFTQAIFVAATQCNLCSAKVATSCDFSAKLFVSANVSTPLVLSKCVLKSEIATQIHHFL